MPYTPEQTELILRRLAASTGTTEILAGTTEARLSYVETQMSLAVLRELGYHNVKAFGAIGNGAANDTAAIQAAIDAAKASGEPGTGSGGRGVVFFPAGTYLITSLSLTNCNKVRLVGAGRDITVLKRASGTAALITATAGTLEAPTDMVEIADLTVHGNSAAGNGIDLTYFTNLRVSRVLALACADGFKFSNCFGASALIHCEAQENSGWGFNLNRQNDEMMLLGCDAAANDTGGFRIADGWEGPWVGSIAVGNPIGVKVEHSANQGATDYGTHYHMRFVGGKIEGTSAQTTGFDVQSATGTKVRNIHFLGLELVNGNGTLVNLDELDGAVGTLHTQGNEITDNHLTLTANSANVRLDWTYVQSGSETLLTDSGTNNQVRDKDLERVKALKIATGATLTAVLKSQQTWDPGSIANGSFASTTFTVTGAATGDVVTVGRLGGTTDGTIVYGQVTSSNTVRVTIANVSGSAADMDNANYDIIVWRAA